MICAVLFDIDNTLYPYAPCDIAGVEKMRCTLSEIMGISINADAFASILSQAKHKVKAYTANTAACHSRMLYSQQICEKCGCFTAENVLRMYNVYWDAYFEQMRLFDGALELLCKIRESGLKLGFCTDLTANIQMRKLVRLGISDIADAVVTSEESGAEKPSSVPYRLLLKKLRTTPENAVMVGDDYQKDVLGAEALGIRAIHFGTNSCHSFHAADYSTLYEIIKGMIV